MAVEITVLHLFTFILAIFLGTELINKVPSQLHTPLMSGANAISGVTIVGAIVATEIGSSFSNFLGVLALIFATINVVGGYLVTDRMLGMFKKGGGGASPVPQTSATNPITKLMKMFRPKERS
ncbi:MAG: NAD(P) transhydrogenase subunit alpha [Deinococcota bacterium]